MNPKVISLAFLALMLFSFVDFFLLALYCITFLFAVALNKALARVASLEAVLKTTSQALKDAKIAKASAKKAAKSAEAKAKRLRKLWLRLLRSNPTVKELSLRNLMRFVCLLAVSSSSCLCVLLKLYLLTCFSWLTCTSVMQQSKLERSGNFGSKVPKTLC
jgi:hypothetical protein